MGNKYNSKVNKVHINIDDYKDNSYYKQYPQLFEKLKALLDGHITCSISRTLNMQCNAQLKNLIISITPLIPLDKSLNERIYWILHDLHDFPICANPNCINGHLKLNGHSHFKGFTRGYQNHCCNRCAQFDPKTTQTKKDTTLERHGDPNYRNPQKTKETYIKNYGVDHPLKSNEFKDKLMQYNLETYGYDWWLNSDECRRRQIQSIKDSCGEDVTNPFQATPVKNKIKQTLLKNYGVDNISKLPAVKEKKLKKMKSTSLDKYGVEWPFQNPEVFAKSRRKLVYDNVQFDSFPEIAYYIWLKDHNIKFEYQPKTVFKYSYDGKDHFYHPDFLLVKENQFIEIKSSSSFIYGKMVCHFDRSLDGLMEAKHQCMLNNNVYIMLTEEYMQYIKYVEKKFGRNFRKQCIKDNNKFDA